MNTDKSQIPKEKQKELQLVVDSILKFFDPIMVILYGSYARGDYVDIPMEYESDFDILVICGQKQKKSHWKQNKLQREIQLEDAITTKVHIEYETLTAVNAEIDKFNYLFVDIRNEGVVLHNPDSTVLNEVKELDPKEKYEKAERDFKYWKKSASDVFAGYKFHLENNTHNWAAFSLHQAVEHNVMALLLVHTGYKPKTHNLNDFVEYGTRVDSTFPNYFPTKKKQDKHLYTLLSRAYVDARYDMTYTISARELQTLEGWVVKFEQFVTGLCEKKLSELKRKAQL